MTTEHDSNPVWLTDAYTKHKDYLISYTYSFIKDWLEAECIVQHAFLQAHRKQNMQDYVLKWLMTVCHNNAVTFVRSRLKVNYCDHTALLQTRETENQDELDCSPLEIVLDREDVVDSKIKQREILETLNKLKNPSLKQVVELRYFHNKSYQEISKIMNIKLGNVGFKLNYALKLMRRYLTNK